MLKEIAEYSHNDREEFLRVIRETQAVQQTTEFAQKKERMEAVVKRISELEKLILRIYEDNTVGRLSDDRYALLDQQYGKEQHALKVELAELRSFVDGAERDGKSVDKFVALIDKYESFDELTTTMLYEFVVKILVYERDC